jgi:hypothetical protein
METGGALWFENLCMSDPFYLLPLLTSTTLYLQVLKWTTGIYGGPFLPASSPCLLNTLPSGTEVNYELSMADLFYLLPLLTSTALYLQVQ